jgi:hypothetical protein
LQTGFGENRFEMDDALLVIKESPIRDAGVVATEGDRREVESLPLTSLGDCVRGRMGESTRQALGRLPDRACRSMEGLFESLLAISIGGA